MFTLVKETNHYDVINSNSHMSGIQTWTSKIDGSLAGTYIRSKLSLRGKQLKVVKIIGSLSR